MDHIHDNNITFLRDDATERRSRTLPDASATPSSLSPQNCGSLFGRVLRTGAGNDGCATLQLISASVPNLPVPSQQFSRSSSRWTSALHPYGLPISPPGRYLDNAWNRYQSPDPPFQPQGIQCVPAAFGISGSVAIMNRFFRNAARVIPPTVVFLANPQMAFTRTVF